MPNQAIPGRLIANGNQILPATTIQNVYDMSDPEHKKRLDHILARLSVLTFTHTKTGTAHQLTGKDGAEYIGFTATADYQEDDTWELNGVPLDGVDFMNGEPLCVGGLIAGDTVMGRVVDGTLTLFLDRPASNPNILDNWYFIDPINQRSFTTSNVAGYTIDRWYSNCYKSGTVTLNLDGIQLDIDVAFAQPIEEYAFLEGRIVTASVLLSDGRLFSISTEFQSGNNTNFIANDTVGFRIGSKLVRSHTNFQFWPYIDANSALTFIAAKLELGPRQTLAHKDAEDNWVLNDPPPDKQQELAKCQRYQIELFDQSRTDQSYLAQVKSTSETRAYGVLPLPVTMRENGTPVVHTDCSNETPYFAFGITSNGNNVNIPITNISIYTTMNNGVVLCATGSGFVPGNDYQIYVRNTNTHHFLLDRNL